MRRTITMALLIMMILCISCSSENDSQTEIEAITYNGVNGKTVFELLAENHNVDYTESDMGNFINTIDGIKNQGGKFWRYFINDQPGQVAADKAILSTGDKVEWRYK